MYNCKEVTTTDTFSVRHLVLRIGKPIETCAFDGDNLPTTKHFCCFDGENAIGVVSVFVNNAPFFEVSNQFQLRGMAVLQNYQKKGIGNKLILFAEKHIRSQNGNLIWFNARLIAIPFYEKMGYTKTGNPFEIGDIGQHFVMFKMM